MIPYEGINAATATLTGTVAGLPGGTLFTIDVGGDTEFAASNVLQTTLPESATSVPVDIRLRSHLGELDGCLAKELVFTVTAVATANSVAGDPLTLDAGHIRFLRMKERSSRWATPENQGCIGRLLPGFLTPRDLMVEAELFVLPDAGLDDSDLPITDVAFTSEDPAIFVFPISSSTLRPDEPILFLFAVRDPRREPPHCGSIRVNFELTRGARQMEARFAVLFFAGGITLDPFANR